MTVRQTHTHRKMYDVDSAIARCHMCACVCVCCAFEGNFSRFASAMRVRRTRTCACMYKYRITHTRRQTVLLLLRPSVRRVGLLCHRRRSRRLAADARRLALALVILSSLGNRVGLVVDLNMYLRMALTQITFGVFTHSAAPLSDNEKYGEWVGERYVVLDSVASRV